MRFRIAFAPAFAAGLLLMTLLAAGKPASAQSCSVIESFDCSTVAGSGNQTCALDFGCGFFGGDTLICDPAGMTGATFPDREISALRPAFPGESGHTLFVPSTVVCSSLASCNSDFCDVGLCGTDFPSSPYITATAYSGDSGSSCQVNYYGY